MLKLGDMGLKLRQSAQIMKTVASQSGFENKLPDFRPAILTTIPTRQLIEFLSYQFIALLAQTKSRQKP